MRGLSYAVRRAVVATAAAASCTTACDTPTANTDNKKEDWLSATAKRKATGRGGSQKVTGEDLFGKAAENTGVPLLGRRHR